jgi:hypothetical protein
MEAAVRLSKFKIEYLSEKILKMIQEQGQIHIIANEDLVVRAAADTIYENILAEDEIDTEVDDLLKENYNEIKAMEMDVGALRQKMKREIARKRGFVL